MSATTDPIDLHDLVAEMCKRLGLSPDYVSRIVLDPGEAEVFIFKGADGSCTGHKYIDQTTGEPAREVVSYAIRS